MMLNPSLSSLKSWRPFTQMKGAPPSIEVLSAKGSYMEIKDQEKGIKRILDAISSWWVITHGHCEPEIVQAVQKQAETLDQVLFAQFSHKASQTLLSLLSKRLPSSLKWAFFSDNGSTSVEVALKMALQSWKQRGEIKRKGFLSFTHSYHGDTIGCMSVGGKGLFSDPYKELLFSSLHASQGTHLKDPTSLFVSDFEKKLKDHSESLAGVILEPFVQGAGGMIMWPKEALKEVCHLTKKHGLYLIFDEVMTGFGRTGEFFAFEKMKDQKLHPDILCLSKGLTGGFLPLALTMASSTVYESFLSDKKEKMFFHGHSFTGNALSSTAASANLKLMEKKDLKKEWRRIESLHKKRIENLKLPGLIEARLCGTIAAIEIENPKKGYASPFAEEFSKWALREGVLLRPLGNVIYILPPYCFSNKELDFVWDVIEGYFHPSSNAVVQ